MGDNNIKYISPVTTGKYILNGNDKKRSYSSVNVQPFRDVLKEVTPKGTEIKFSKHAEERILSRNIKLTPNDIDKLTNAINMANKKGVKDSLVIMDSTAFIVNIPSKIVVTAVDDQNIKQNIFTNIDGAVII